MVILFDLALRFGAIGLLALLAVSLFKKRHRALPAVIAIVFAITLISYLLCSAPFWPDMPNWLQSFLLVGCLANPLLFWLFAQSIFEDGFRLRWRHALIFISVEAAGFWYLFGSEPEFTGASSTLQTHLRAVAGVALPVVAIALVIFALITAYRGRVPDLVESRRRFRTLFVSITGAYMVFVILVEVFLRGATPHPVASLLNAAAIFAIVFFMAISLLGVKFTLLLEPIRSPLPAVELDAAERALLERLDEALAAQKIHHQEGLTITKLAAQLGAQEHRLRQLINAKMGFRNFNDFVNHYRVQDACAELAEPGKARLPVLTIAMNLGYRSLGPFNRAFKEITGLTPTEFRRQKLGVEPIDSSTKAQPEA